MTRTALTAALKTLSPAMTKALNKMVKEDRAFPGTSLPTASAINEHTLLALRNRGLLNSESNGLSFKHSTFTLGFDSALIAA